MGGGSAEPADRVSTVSPKQPPAFAVQANDSPPSPSPSDRLFIELCAGAGMLSYCFKEVGFQILPVDHKANRFHPHVHLVHLDLTREHSWRFLDTVLEEYDVCFVHAAPPCGTCFRARDIELGDDASRPVRSLQFPWGVDGLMPTEQARVDAANGIYQGMCRFLERCTVLQIPWSVENPASSLLWQIPVWSKLSRHARFVEFAACAWGSKRPTKKAFLTTLPGLSMLEAQCPGNHIHEPHSRKRRADGSWHSATSAEVAHPRELCVAIRQCVMASQAYPTPAQPVSSHINATVRGTIALHKQPRGRRVPPIVPEYLRVCTVILQSQPILNSKKCLTLQSGPIPAGSRLLNVHVIQSGDQKGHFNCTFGIYRSVSAFVDAALLARHPFEQFHTLPDDMLKVVFRTVTLGPAAIASRRAEILKLWSSWARELDSDEKALKSKMEPV